MYIRVVPLTRLPRNLTDFDYKLKSTQAKPVVGQLLKINFKNKSLIGFVSAVNVRASVRNVKEVISLLPINLSLTENQLTTLSQIANKLFISLAEAAKVFLPDLTAQLVNIPSAVKTPATSTDKLNLNLHKLNFVEINLWQKKIDFYLALVRSLKDFEQIIFFVPSKQNAESLYAQISSAMPVEEILVINADQNKKLNTEQWLRVKTAQAKVIIGTRKALLYPWQNLKYIIVDKAANEHHRQWDQSPRYELNEIVALLADIYKTKVVYVDCMPNMQIYNQLKEKKIKYFRINSPNTAHKKIVDISNSGWLNDGLIKVLNDNVEHSIKSIIIVNRVLKNKLLICNDCKFVLKCNNCDRVLNYNDNTKVFLCPLCNAKYDSVSTCGQCSSANVSLIETGLDKIVTILKNTFPQQKILNTKDDFNYISSIIDADIIITTSAIVDRLYMYKKSSIIIPIAEQFLTPVDIDTQWNFLYLLKTVLSYSLPLTVQFNGESKNIEYLNDIDLFLRNELKLLRSTFLPPTASILKIIVKDTKTEQLNKKATELVARLQKDFPKCLIVGPYQANPPLQYNKYRLNILVKKIATQDLDKITKMRYSNVVYDINPLKLLN